MERTRVTIEHVKAAIRDVAPQPGFRDYLQQQLAMRCARNAQYSLRAFANYLGVNHSTLSQMLRGKRTITAEAIEKFGFRLGLSPKQIGGWIQGEKQRPLKGTAQQGQLHQLARDAAEVLEDWRNFAILELTRLEDFQTDSRWIARMLGITVDEVNIAISRLCRLRLLKMNEDGRWQDQLGDAVMDLDSFSAAAIEKMMQQMHELTAAGVRDASDRCEHSSATIAVASSQVQQALEKVAAFRMELLQWLAAAPAKDEVYQLEIRFVPVTRRNGN